FKPSCFSAASARKPGDATTESSIEADVTDARSDPAGVHDIVLRRAGRRVVGCQENAETGNVFRLDPSFEALRFEPLLVALGREPFGQLPLGPDPARSNRV